MKLIGIAGTNGSGKDTVGHLLAEKHNYLFISMTDMLREELRLRNLPPARKHMRELSAEWRKEGGLGILIDKAVEVFNKDKGNQVGLVVASIRNPGEVDKVHELDGHVVWVDADPRVRYDRIQANLEARGEHRAIDDMGSFEHFLSEEQAEMQHSGDETTLNMSGVKLKADIFVENNGNNIQAFKDEAEKKLASVI